MDSKTFKLIAVGGLTGHEYMSLSDVEYFNPYNADNSCPKLPDYPKSVSRHFGTETMFCGGVDDTLVQQKSCYVLNGNEWASAGDLVYPLIDSSSAYLSNRSFIVLGGNEIDNRHPSSHSEIKTDTITPFQMSSELPETMYGHCIGTINETHMFVAGNGNKNGRAAYMIDTTEDDIKFMQLPDMKEKRVGSACGTFYSSSTDTEFDYEKLLIVAGGFSQDTGTPLSSSEIFSISQNKWIAGPSLPKGYESGGYFSDEMNPLIIVGGWDEHKEDTSDVIQYMPDKNLFEMLPARLQIARHWFPLTGIYSDDNC